MGLEHLDAELEHELLGLDDALGEPALAFGAADGAVAKDFDVSFLSELLSEDHGQLVVGLNTTFAVPLSTASSDHLPVSSRQDGSCLVDDDMEALGTGVSSSGHESSSPSGSTSPAPSTPTDTSKHQAVVDELTLSTTPEERKARRRAQMVVNARLHRKRKKGELADLHEQVDALQRHLKMLRAERGLDESVGSWEECAQAHRRKRRQADELNDLLKRALLSQRFAALGLTSSVLSVMPIGSELSMHHLLHSYTRLGRHATLRAREYERLCSLSKLDLALQVVAQETATLLFDTPSISTRQVPAEAGEYAMTTVSVFAFKTHNLQRIYSDACTAILGCGSMRPDFTLRRFQSDVVDSSPAPQICYGVTEATYTSDSSGDVVHVEDRSVAYYHATHKYAALMWDFVDVDDLHPLKQETHMKRDAVGALLVRLEECEDGVERVVCRSICTKILRVHSHAPPKEVAPFLLSGVQACSCHMYKQIRDGAADPRV